MVSQVVVVAIATVCAYAVWSTYIAAPAKATSARKAHRSGEEEEHIKDKPVPGKDVALSKDTVSELARRISGGLSHGVEETIGEACVCAMHAVVCTCAAAAGPSTTANTDLHAPAKASSAPIGPTSTRVNETHADNGPHVVDEDKGTFAEVLKGHKDEAPGLNKGTFAAIVKDHEV